MKQTILFGQILGLIVAGLSLPGWAQDSKSTFNLRETAESIRKGEISVGKEYSLDPEVGRFHRVHASVLGLADETILDIRCGGCHTTEKYPDSYLYLRKDEFPYTYKNIKVRAVQRHFCIGCHSGGSVSTVFYNPKK